MAAGLNCDVRWGLEMETVLFVIIVVLAALYLGKHFFSMFKNKKTACGCGGCGNRYGQEPLNEENKTL